MCSFLLGGGKMLKILREIKLSLIMDALLSEEVKVENNNSNFCKYYSKNNRIKFNKSKKRVKIRN